VTNQSRGLISAFGTRTVQYLLGKTSFNCACVCACVRVRARASARERERSEAMADNRRSP
jgi:hypothetical protein